MGTVLGMMLLTTALAIPAAASAQRFRNFERGLVRLTGFASVIFGLVRVYQIGFVDGLFSAQPTWAPR
jgi:high-affinity nickel-transport protein